MTEDDELKKTCLGATPLKELMESTLNDWRKSIEKSFYNTNALEAIRKALDALPPYPLPEEEKEHKEPRYFAYFYGYDNEGWMESYHTKKEALKDIRVHKDSFDCLVKGKIIK